MRSLLVLAALVAFVAVAEAHSWYEGACCSNNDCWPVHDDEVVEMRGGGWKHLPTGAEFRDRPGDVRVRPSRDRHFHVCVRPNSYEGLCIYVRQGT